MTKQQASSRNWDIMQLIGMLPRVVSLIPPDIAMAIPKEDLVELRRLTSNVLKVINSAKVPRFTCDLCTDILLEKPTKNKRAYRCDICGDYYDDLYNIKRN